MLRRDGKPRRFTLSLGTIEVRRPHGVRNLEERFGSKVLDFFKRQTREVRELRALLVRAPRPPDLLYTPIDRGSF